MLTAVFRRASVRARIESNPLGSVLQDYIAYLVARGHRPGPLHQYIFAVEHFGRWIRGRTIDRAAVERFIRQHLPRCRCAKPCPRAPNTVRAALLRLLEMLEVGRGQARDGDVIGGLLDDYEKHLRRTCGLAEVTVSYRRRYARGLLRGLGVRRVRDLRRWSPQQVVGHVTALARTHKPSSGNVVASSIRSFLRFLLLRGIIMKDLAAAVPSFANWRLASLPTTVDKDDLMRLVAAVDCSCGIGMRDRAVLLCMTELGLRAVEVALIAKDDVDLDAGTMRLRRPKQREHVEIPMTRRLVVAIRSYLQRGRPRSGSAALFVKHRAPLGEPLKPIAIHTLVVRRAVDAGLGDRVRGSHVIRHSIATTLINEGVPIKRIADFMGHRCIDTTAIYAKVDLVSLRGVALPWPSAAQVEVRS